MTMPTDSEVYDSGRDAIALIRAQLAGDDQAAEAILGHADLYHVASTLSGIASKLLLDRAEMLGIPDPSAAADQLLLDGLAKELPDTPGIV